VTSPGGLSPAETSAEHAKVGSHRQPRWRKYGPAVAIFLGGLVFWEAVVRLFAIQAFVLPKPSEILQRLVDQWDVIAGITGNTLLEAIGGLVGGTVSGVAIALITVRWKAAREGIMPFAIATNAIPIIALAPIVNNMFPITSPVSKMTTVAIVVFFPVMINTTRGLTEVETAEIELMRSYAATPRDIFRRVRIPHALPYFFSALKVATTLSIIVAIVAEYFGGPQDVLGQYILTKASLFVYPDAWAAIVVASLIGIGLYGVVLVVERISMSWHVSLRAVDEN